MVNPAQFSGSSDLETQNIRVTLRSPDPKSQPDPGTIAELKLENKRDVMARVDATRSCVIHPRRGAFNLLAQDRIVPPASWVILGSAFPFRFGSAVWVSGRASGWPGNEDLEQASRRILLTVRWDDGLTESLDLSYNFVRKEPGEQVVGR